MLFAVALRCSTSCRTQNAINSELVFISSNGNVAIKLALRFHFDGNWIESIGKTFSIRSNDGTFVACFPWVCVTQQCYKTVYFALLSQLLGDINTLTHNNKYWKTQVFYLSFYWNESAKKLSPFYTEKSKLVHRKSSWGSVILSNIFLVTLALIHCFIQELIVHAVMLLPNATNTHTRVWFTKHDRWLSRSYRCGSTTKAQFWKCIRNDKYMLLYSQMERSNKPQSERKTRPNRFPYCIPKMYSVYQSKNNNTEMYAVQLDMHYELTRFA